MKTDHVQAILDHLKAKAAEHQNDNEGCLFPGADADCINPNHWWVKLADVAAALRAHPTQEPVYYAEALDLVCDELRALQPDKFLDRRDKIIAIITNAAHALRAALRAHPEPEVPVGAVLAAEHFENMVRETVDTIVQIEKRIGYPLPDDERMIQHYRKNLDYFTVRAEGVRAALRAWRAPQGSIELYTQGFEVGYYAAQCAASAAEIPFAVREKIARDAYLAGVGRGALPDTATIVEKK